MNLKLEERLREEQAEGRPPEIGEQLHAIAGKCEIARRAICAAFKKSASSIAAAAR